MMVITVFGANGRVGSLVVQKLAEQGHSVRAFVHGEPNQRLASVTYIQGDVADKTSISEALQGAEAVVSALGSWGTKDKNILTVAMKNIIPLMEAQGIRRIVSLTGADARVEGEPHPIISHFSHALFSRVAPKIMQDGEAHIALLKQSQLDWTVLRSPVMNEKGRGVYVLNGAYPLPWQTIHRHAVAQAMVDQVAVADFVKAAPYIHRKR